MAQKIRDLSLARNIKIGMFHLGSGMVDVLATGVWNRVMISDLGISATPVSLLVSLRYFLAPLGIWAGRMSDERTVLGFRRLFWIWFGRLLMVLSTFGLGYATSQLALHSDEATLLIWSTIVVSMVLFSLGNALSGTTFLALIYDRAGEDQRGRAVGIVWTFLLLGFTIGGIVFSVMLPKSESGSLSFTPQDLQTLFFVAGGIFLALWFFSLLGEEHRQTITAGSSSSGDVRHSMSGDLALVWHYVPMRFFLFYLSLSMIFAFSQDPVLEPFAGDVFHMEASVTNRFSAYWGSMSIIGSLVSLWLLRKRERFTHERLSQIGVAILIVTFVLLTAAALLEIRAIITPGLLLLGLGLGFWNIGTLSLMMDMSPLGRAGTFLGFWSMVVTLSRGVGITGGGIVRDVGLQFSGDAKTAYGLVFGVALVGMLVAAWCLNRVHVQAFKDSLMHDTDAAAVFAASLD